MTVLRPLKRISFCLTGGGFVAAVFFLLLAAPLRAALPPCEPEIEAAIYRLDFERADALSRALRKPLVGEFYLHHTAFLRALLRPNAERRAHFDRRSSAAEALLDKAAASDFRALFRAEMYLERAILQLTSNEMWGGFWDLNRCWQQTQELNGSIGQHPAFDRFAGLFEVGFSAVPSRYRWALRILGLNGSLKAGVVRLTRAADSETFLARQNELILYFVHRNLLADPEGAGDRIRARLAKEPNHVLWNYFLGYNALDLQRNEPAWNYLKAACSQPEADWFPFAFLMAGRSALYREQHGLAIDWFRAFLKRYQGALYRTDACFRIAVCHAQQGRSDASRLALRECLEMPEAVIDEDRYARRQAEILLQRPFTKQELTFFRIRYAIDGGYYARARELLDGLAAHESSLNPDDRAELRYRYGRIEHLNKRHAEAIAQYQRATAEAAVAKLWMKVFALLYQGQIHEELGQAEAARRCYKQALTFSDYDYQSGLEQRALAGLRRLSEK